MTIKCVNCKELVKVPEDILRSGKLQFTCHLCNTAQEIKTEKIMQEKKKAGKLSVVYAGKQVAVHDIFVGKNLVGRTSEEKKSNIEFSEDKYLSRQHFIIEICENKHGYFEYLACYNKARNKTTIISGKREKELSHSEKIMLSNGDKIVAGKTTFVLETENNPAVTPPKASGVTEQAK